ncbi:unnamed protein product [Schistosoma rodhaini]|nr:unnamed protein product [Schistosoma rodhaini]
MVSIVENIEWEGDNVLNVMKHVGRLRVVSKYTKRVFTLVAIQISIAFVVIMLFSMPWIECLRNTQHIPYIFAGIFFSIAFVILLLVVLVKNISEKYPPNVMFVIIYSISMAIAIAVWNLQLSILCKLAVFGISLVLFTSSLLIGAAIKTKLVDQSIRILISFFVISIVILVVGFLLSLWQYKNSTIGAYIGAQILLFIITIFISHFTVGKSRYLIFYPNYSLAAIILYTVFLSSLSINTDILNFNNKTENCTIQFKLTENFINV